MNAIVAPSPAAPNVPQAAGSAIERAKTSAREFEAVFLTNMMEEMFAGLEEDDGPFGGGGAGSAIWKSLRTEQYAQSIAAAGGIGIADHVQRQLIALQETQK